MEGRWKWILITAIAPIAWGSTYVVTRQFLPADEPLWGAAYRALPAAVILLLVTRRLPRGAWWWRSLVLGVLNVGGFFVLVYIAAQLLPSSLAATIMALAAGVLMLLAWPVLGERPGLLPSIGVALGFLGVVALVGVGAGDVKGWGILASVAAMLSSSVGFVLTKRWGATESATVMASWQLAAGALLLVPVAALVEGAPSPVGLPQVVAFGYVTVVATALAYVAWFAGLRRLPAGAVGTIGLLNPVTGVTLGTAFAAEVFGPAQAVGTALVLAGVVLAGRSRRRNDSV